MYTELFKLCGYDEEGIERERPRIDKAFTRLEICAEDIKRGESRVKGLFNTELIGVRKLFGIAMKETIDWVLAKDEGKKLIYGSFPPNKQIFQPMMYACPDLYVGCPEVPISTVMGGIFDKSIPIFEAAEANGLAVGQAHCTLIKSKLGLIAKGMIPLPDLLLTYACEQSSKLDELIHEFYGVPIVRSDGCHDQNWGDYPNVKDRRIRYAGARINMLIQKVEEMFGFQVTEESKELAIKDNIQVWINFMTLCDFVAKCDPPPLSQADLSPILGLAFGGCLPGRTEELVAALGSLIEQAKQISGQGQGVVEKGAPRVLWFTGNPEAYHMMERLGLNVITAANFLSLMVQRRSEPKYTTFAECIAEGFLSDGPGFGSEGFVEFFKQMCIKLKPDGFVLPYLYYCRPLSISPLMIKKTIQDELHIPVLAMEWDPGDKRDYPIEQLRTRIETFAELVKARKAQ